MNCLKLKAMSESLQSFIEMLVSGVTCRHSEETNRDLERSVCLLLDNPVASAMTLTLMVCVEAQA